MKPVNKAVLGGSIILLIMFNIFNVLNFIFQASMSRMLTLSEYGIFATIYAFLYIIIVFSDSIQTIVVKYAANESDTGKLKNLFFRTFKKASLVSLVLFIIYILIAIPLSTVLRIPYFLFALSGLSLFGLFYVPIGRGILQGRRKFGPLGWTMIIEGLSKLILALFLVYLGWKVSGAIVATIIASLLAFLFSLFYLKPIFKVKERHAEVPGIYGYSAPVFFITLAVILFYSIDMIIVKILFDSEVAGSYAIFAILAKIIYIGTQPVGRAMFPLSAQKEDGPKQKNIFYSAFLILSILLILVLGLFISVPNFIIQVFSGKDLANLSSVLFYLGIGMAIISIAHIVLMYKLSIGATKRSWCMLLFIPLEAVLLVLFSQTLITFSLAFICSAIIFLLGALVIVGKK